MKQGFSLVELSIVLVILGLLVGGVLAGQSLIRASQLRVITTEFQRYVTASQTFRDKYFALPGDMPNATSFWGVQNSTPATCVTTASTSALTCNGDGDGIIDVSAGSNEQYRFWQHLANAGLVEGSYNGIAGVSGSDDSDVGINVPASKFTPAGWTVRNLDGFPGNASSYAGNWGNVLDVGADAGGNTSTSGAIISTQEAWNIDTKLDDGVPGVGKVIAVQLNQCTSSVSNTDYTGTYLLSVAGNKCALRFAHAF